MYDVSSGTLEELIRKNQVILTKRQKAYLKLNRVLDFCCSLIALVVLSPVLLIIAVSIKLETPGEKIIFKQERVGQNGKTFMLYKFRSMKKEAPELGTGEFLNAEQYITRVGKFLRKTSLDELPQLWSVICGDMSLVGERPLILREEEVHFLRNYYGIYQLKPGITGLAQINGRDNMGNYDKVRWDRTYVHNVSFLLDLKILWSTVMKVLKREGIVDEAPAKEALIQQAAYNRTEKLYNDEVEMVK